MKFIDKIKNFFADGGSQNNSYFLEGKEFGNIRTKDYYDSYSLSYIVFACLDKIQKNTSRIEIDLYKTQRNKVKEIYNHESLDLLYSVNNSTTFKQMIGMTQLCLDIIGSSYWYKKRNKSGVVTELWLLRPDCMTAKAENGEYISYYEYTGRGNPERFEVEDIIPFLNPNPIDSKLGQSKVQPAMDLIKAQLFSTKWNMNFFYREARPDAILNVKGRKTMEKDEKEEVREQWNEQFGGYGKSHKLAIMNGELDYKIIGENQKDMDFVNLDQSTRNNIMMALGVPKPILLPEEGNKTTVEGAIYIFMSQTIEPNMSNIVDTLNEYFIKDYDPTLFLDFKSPVPEDDESEAKVLGDYVDKGIMTRNEARDKLGLPELEGGDEVLVPVTLIPMSSSGEAKTEEGEKRFKALKISKTSKDKLTEKKEKEIFYKHIRGNSKHYEVEKSKDNKIDRIADNLTDKLKSLDGGITKKDFKLKKYTPEMKQKLWESFDKTFTSTEKSFRILFEKLEQEQNNRINGYLFKSRKSKEYILKKDLSESVDNYNWKKEIQIFIDAALPLHTETIVKAGQTAAERIGSAFDINSEVRAYIKTKNLKFATEVNNTTKENLKKTLSQGLEEGESLEDLKKRVEHTFTIRKGSGARAVASTETLASVNGGWLEAYKQSGVVEKKEWYHSGSSENDRPSHIAISGEKRLLKDKFSIGLSFPGDPNASPDETVNCKCIILEVIE